MTARAIVAAALAISAPTAGAHHDTEAMIARFTERIETGEATAELYYRRATEYRVLRDAAQAEADLLRALERDERFVPALQELAKLRAKAEDFDAALLSAEQAITVSESDSERAAGLVLLARLKAAAGYPAEALAACERAFELRPRGEVEWFLLRSELLGGLDRGDERPALLDAGYAATGSIVLRNARIDALLDNAQTATALPVIEEELAGSRLKSSWLLRRARARMIDGDRAAATADLEACLAELAGRIHPARPDLTLVADRGLANALLGRPDAARSDLARARAGGADRWVTAALEAALIDEAR